MNKSNYTKTLKGAIIVVVILVAFVLIVPLFLQDEYHVRQEIVINKSKQYVFEYVQYLKNQDNYSVWAKMDPGMEKTYTGRDATVGFISAWDSENEDVGTGEQEIIGIAEGERIDYELRFFEPLKATNKAFIALEKVNDNQTRVTWGLDGRMEYPTNLLILYIETLLGKDLMGGLENLKVELETPLPNMDAFRSK